MIHTGHVNFSTEEQGSSMGTGQRKQASLEGANGAGFEALIAMLKKEVACYEARLIGMGFKLVLKQPVVVGNDPTGPDGPVKAQARHTDMRHGSYGIVAIVALAPMTLLVSPMSHLLLVLEWIRQKGRRLSPAKISANMPRGVPMKRVLLQPGQILYMHGNLVHAGAAGFADVWSPRVHFYLQDKPVENATYYTEQVDPLFAKKFVDEF